MLFANLNNIFLNIPSAEKKFDVKKSLYIAFIIASSQSVNMTSVSKPCLKAS